jgi:Ala-tRNA(Pro) deacylase
MDCKDRLESHLDEDRMPPETHHHPTAFTAQEVAASEHTPGKMVVKAVMVLADGERAMLAMPAPYQAELKRVAEVLGAPEVRLAHEEEFTLAFPDCEVDAMPPLGSLYGLPVYVDETLAEDETIVVQAGTHSDTIRFKYAGFERVASPTVARFAYHI